MTVEGRYWPQIIIAYKDRLLFWPFQAFFLSSQATRQSLKYFIYLLTPASFSSQLLAGSDHAKHSDPDPSTSLELQAEKNYLA